MAYAAGRAQTRLKSAFMEVLMIKSRWVRVAAIGLLAALFGGSAQAAPQFYNWYLDFTVGPLAGQEAQGTISVNGAGCPAGKCVGNFTAAPPVVTDQLLSLNITVGGISFAMANDTGFGSGFPDVTFGPNGVLSGVDYQGQVVSGGVTYTLDTSGANVGDLVAFYRGPVGSPAPGTLSIARLGVPEPGTIPLLGAALIGVVLIARRQASGRPAGLLS
jgi:hypothetical protein